ncbi:dehydrogenase [Gammaproteobacteria bacterium 45_16_T64]|nr:dehydrogenase [Gammaproteobacteria bacterium 45_16_T64]
MESKHVICATCDIACQLIATREKGEARFTLAGNLDHPIAPGAICAKGKLAHEVFEHPNRLTKPLKRVGERGEGKWEEISWEQALGEIAEKLQGVIKQHGPEALVVSSGPWNCSTESGMTRRFMNLLGSPNYLSPVALCLGNTAAVNRLTYGWMPLPDFENTQCIVMMGHNPHNQSWVWEYIRLRLAEKRGAKLICFDPRLSQTADRADIHLALKPGTDGALCMGWLRVIVEEKLYDKAFVKNWTVGFDQLKQRLAQDFTLDKVSEITGVSVEDIQQSARMYATAESAIIPWSPITDQHVSSTSAIRAISILRAITGNLDAPGGEMLMGVNPNIISESEIELTQALSDEQRKKQLGYHQHPVFTFKAADLLSEHSQRVFGIEYPNIVKGAHMAVPSPTFRAMAYGDPYPVKAFISIANNSLMGYGNQTLIKEAMLNQDLNVCVDLFMTPTGNLCDYVLPGDTWLERPNLMDTYEWSTMLQSSYALYDPPAECKNVYFFIKELAHRMGLAEHFPWGTVTDLFDYRLQPLGMSYQEFTDNYKMKFSEYKYYNYKKTGFATPSGKVELYSSVLEDLGFDPLPYYRNVPEPNAEYPLKFFVGLREPQFFQSGQRHARVLRKGNRTPRTFVNPIDAKKFGLIEGEWATIETHVGKIHMEVLVRDDIPQGLIRVPHGWWLPEENDLGAFEHNDGVIVPDSEEYLDREQGIPHLKGVPCKIYPRIEQREYIGLKGVK